MPWADKVALRSNVSLPQKRAGSADVLILSSEGRSRAASWTAGLSPIRGGATDQAISLMEKYISRVSKRLEAMREMTIAAEGSHLNLLDRLNMQIDLNRLESGLMGDIKAMSLEMAGKTPEKIAELLAFYRQEVPYGQRAASGDLSIFERARDRILKGEDWDVVEVYESVVRIEGRLSPSPSPLGKVIEADSFMVEGRYVVSQDSSLPTTKDRFEEYKNSGSISLLDSKSATHGTESLDLQLEALEKFKGELEKFKKELVSAPNGTLREPVSPERQEGLSVHTEHGEMTYQTNSRGVRDPADLRLTRPTSRTGALYARLENFLKEELAQSLGLLVTFDFDLPGKGWEKADGTHDSITIFNGEELSHRR